MIIIEKSAVAENGASVTHHFVKKAEVSPDGDAIVLMVDSWPDAAARLSGFGPVAHAAARIPLAELPSASSLLDDIAAALTSAGWLTGGTVSADLGDNLQSAKTRRWAAIKSRRTAEEYAGFMWNGWKFDSDPMSQSRVQGAVILAMQAAAAGEDFSVTWTLFDNSTQALTGVQMLAVGGALAQHVMTLHATAQWLRAQIEAATTVAEVAAIVWPEA